MFGSYFCEDLIQCAIHETLQYCRFHVRLLLTIANKEAAYNVKFQCKYDKMRIPEHLLLVY